MSRSQTLIIIISIIVRKMRRCHFIVLLVFLVASTASQEISTSNQNSDAIQFGVANRTAEKVNFDEGYKIYNETHLVTTLEPYARNNCTEVLQGTDFSKANFKPRKNGFVHTVLTAYNKHHNLVIRPDDVWIAIATQFSFYVNANAEKFRGKFVDFEGQRELVVHMGSGNRYTVPHDEFIKLMTKEIHKNLVDPEVRNWILPNFTTTTDDDYVTCGVVLMSSLKKYFTYTESIACGIPYVTLLGTVEDWEKVREKAQRLKNYELGNWVEILDPILAQFIEARKGKLDANFWGKMVNHLGGMASGPAYTSGWISAFSVFNEKGIWQATSSAKSDWPLIEIEKIPSGIVEVDVLIDDNGQEFKSVLFAGHMATEALEDGFTIQPKSGWAMALKGDEINWDRHKLWEWQRSNGQDNYGFCRQ